MVRNLLDQTFARLRREKKKALVGYLTAGYPNFKEQETWIPRLAKAGLDVLEIGVPFSDPIADGPTIQFSSQESLKRGATLTGILKFASRLNRRAALPLVIMSYLNPILRYGLKRFARHASRSGIQGVIVPDMIVEEAADIKRVLDGENIHLIPLVAPTTPKRRQKTMATRNGGFLYAVSVAGVTGARKRYSTGTKRWLSSLSSLARCPVCVGFGISSRDQIRQLKGCVDGFIVGSALIDRIRKSSGRRRQRALVKFISELSKECRYGR